MPLIINIRFFKSTNRFNKILINYKKHKLNNNNYLLNFITKYISIYTKQFEIKSIIKFHIQCSKLLKTIIRKKIQKNTYIPIRSKYLRSYYKNYLKNILSKLSIMVLLNNTSTLLQNYKNISLYNLKTNYYINDEKLLYYQLVYYNFITNFVSTIYSTSLKKPFFTNKYSYNNYLIVLIYEKSRKFFFQTFIICLKNKILKIRNEYRF